MKTLSLLPLAFVVLTLSAAPLLAAEGGAAPSGPCAEDIAKFCKDVQPGGGRKAKCLKEHESDLSTGCKAQFEASQKRGRHAADACKADTEKFCKDVQRGGGRMKKCLTEHKADLSAECKTVISAQ